MNSFKELFGIDKKDIRKTCILLPVLLKEFLEKLQIDKLNRGFPFSSSSIKDFTVIHTNVGASFVGDCILYLEKSPCRNIILFGSCGAVEKSKDLQIGELASPNKCYNLESFSDMLNNKKPIKTCSPDQLLLKSLTGIKKVSCATVGSIKLEKEYKDFFISKNIDILDMECSSCFNASNKTNKRAIAVFYITDLLDKKNPYTKKTLREKQAIIKAQKQGIEIIKSIIKYTKELEP